MWYCGGNQGSLTRFGYPWLCCWASSPFPRPVVMMVLGQGPYFVPRTGGLQLLELPWPATAKFGAENRAVTWGRRINISCETGSKVQLESWEWLWAGAAWEESSGQSVLAAFCLGC